MKISNVSVEMSHKERVNVLKFLGVWMDEKSAWRTHIEKTTCECERATSSVVQQEVTSGLRDALHVTRTWFLGKMGLVGGRSHWAPAYLTSCLFEELNCWPVYGV